MNVRTSKDTKTAARQALSNNWGTAILVAFLMFAITGAIGSLYSMISVVLSFVSAASSVIGTNVFGSVFYAGNDFFDVTTTVPGMADALSGFGITTAIALAIIFTAVFVLADLLLFAVSANLSVGCARYYINLVSGNNAKISDLFFSFKYCPLKSLWVTLLVALKTLLWGLAALVPAGICYGVAVYLLIIDCPVYVGALLCFCAVAFFIAAVLLMIYASYRYCLAYFILAKEPQLGVRETIRKAKETINGYKNDRFMLDLSFIGWELLVVLAGMLTFGIGAFVGTLFLNPYMWASQAVQFCDITGTPTVRHDFTNPPYQGYQGFQSNTYNNNNEE